MPLDDIYGFSDRLQRELDQLDVHHENDRDAVDRFIRKKANTIKDSTLWHYLSQLRRVAEFYDGAITELTDEELDQLIFDLRHTPAFGRGDANGMSLRTARGYQETLCYFLRFSGYSWAADYEMIDRDEARDDIDPGQMLTSEDIADLVSAAGTQRDIAIIEFLADTGARIGMAASLRVRDVDLDGDTATYTPNPNAKSLKDAPIKPYPIIDAKASLRAYVHQTHPRPDDGNAALFHAQDGRYDPEDDGGLSPPHFHRRLSKIAEKAGIDKPTNPHNFRHSAISRMWREGYEKQQIQHRVGWVLDTDMWETYVHLHAEDMNNSIFADAGEVEPDTRESPGRTNCGNCRETLAEHRDHCANCGEPATPEAQETLTSAISDGVDELGDADLSDTERQQVALAVKILQNDGALLPGRSESS